MQKVFTTVFFKSNYQNNEVGAAPVQKVELQKVELQKVERSKGRIFQFKYFFLNVKKKSKNNVSYSLGLIFHFTNVHDFNPCQ